MAWNDAITQTTDWSDEAFVGQFWAALRERLLVARQTAAWTAPEAGDYVGAATAHTPGQAYSETNATKTWSIRTLQSMLEDLLDDGAAVRWVPRSLNLAASGSATFTDHLLTLSSWRSAAGLHADGFTRKYPSGGVTATAHGLMEPGDYIGPWVWQELRAAINELVRTGHRVQAISHGTDDQQWESETNTWSTYAAAKAEAASTWYRYSDDGVPVYGYTQVTQSGGEFTAYGLFHQARFRGPADADQAAPGGDTELYTGLDHVAELWLWADDAADSYTLDPFETFGQGFVEGWNKVQEWAASDTARHDSDIVNPSSTAPTVFPAEPAEGQTLTTGFAIGAGSSDSEDQGILVVKWDVDGGLTHRPA